MAGGQLVVDFWNVGQGDCSVIHLPSGEIILIDVGPIGSPIVDWFSSQPHRRIHSIVLTHNDSDHVGALTSLVDCCSGRIGTVYVMADRNVKDPRFRDLYRQTERARKTGGVQDIRRLEAPATVWSDAKSGFRLEVRYPTMSANVLASIPNMTSAILVLAADGSKSILLAGDTAIANVAAVASDTAPAYMLGPHHGGPIDRRQKGFPANLATVGPGTVVASVGSGNIYGHPCVSYIKHVRRLRATFQCTQLTKHCEKPSRLRHVCKGAALLGLPQVSTGYSCRGTIRLTYTGTDFLPDPVAEKLHAEGIAELTRPKCLRYP